MKNPSNVDLYIHGENEVNRVAREIAPVLIGQIIPFIGKKILTINGKTKKFADAILSVDDARKKFNVQPATPGGFATLHDYAINKQYNGELNLRISICFSGGKYEDNSYYCHYTEYAVLQIGTMSADTLTGALAISKYEPLNKESELRKVAEYRVAAELAHSLKKGIRLPEGIYKYA
jgi:hypothetical protein